METPLIYIDCEIPSGMTLIEYRRSLCAGRATRRPLWRRVLRRA